ncbi:uncharacterized protein LOC142766096 [Rhipicephalus microplus]|uniref:uncharacterized protein LOC142766096 n=1 Tax=Rhipicephalus microplus TaxID=6941 RepID=UPI003F6C4F49
MEDGDWQSSKENTQPLNEDRHMSSQQAARAPQCQEEDLKQKRREFEEELRTSSGVALLDVYHRYLLWVEQHHFTSSVNVPQLLEQAIVQFKTNTELFNDKRCVGICMRHAVLSAEPVATFQAMFQSGIGEQHAEFYAAWAQQLEASGDTCGASRVLKGGIDRRAAPTSQLERALRQLEARVSRQITDDVQQQCQEAALVGGPKQNLPSVLSPWRPQKQDTVPVTLSVPAARLAEQRGLATVTAGSVAGSQGHTNVRVQADENTPGGGDDLLIHPVATQDFAPATQLTMENTRTAGQCSGVTTKQQLPPAPLQPGFKVPEVQGGLPPPCTSTLVSGCRQGLSERKKSEEMYDDFGWDQWQVPLCRPDPAGLPVRPMYDKASVYRGTTEFQFEEIRLANIRALEREMFERQLEAERNQEVQALKRQLRQMRKELDLLHSLLAQKRSGSNDHAAVTSKIVQLEQSILVAEQSILIQPTSSSGTEEGVRGQRDEVDMTTGTPSAHRVSGAGSAESNQSGGSLSPADVSKVVRSFCNRTLGKPHLSLQDSTDCTLQAAPKNTVDELQTETAVEDAAAVVGVPAASCVAFLEPTETEVLACGAHLPPIGDAPGMGGNDENRLQVDCSPPGASVKTKSLQRGVSFAELLMYNDKALEDAEHDIGVERLDDEDSLTYARSKSFPRKLTSTPCVTDHTLPVLGEYFTVGGLTALVQELDIRDPSASSRPAAKLPSAGPLVQPPQQVEQQQPSRTGVPVPPGAAARNCAAPRAMRRFSVAVAGGLSPINECSKEDKSSSNSGGSTSSSSSSTQHMASVTTLSTTAQPPSGRSCTLPAIKEETDEYCGVFLAAQAAAAPERSQQHDEGLEQAASALACGNPFSEELRNTILATWQLQKSDQGKLFESAGNRPALKEGAQITLGDHEVKVLRHLASGAYAPVYLAQMGNAEETCLDDEESFDAPSQVKVVLKVDDSRSRACWESYICCELHRRLSESSETLTKCVVDLQLACFFSNGAITVFPYSPYGNLLDLVNRFKEHCRSSVPECLVLYFALELITILQQVHLCGIIHADIKPENILIVDFPSKTGFLDTLSEQGPSCLQLKEFGRAIDMRQLPPGSAFTHVVTTEGFVCPEMRDSRQWTFQTDWFGLLGCLHVLLFGHYMEVEKSSDDTWRIRNKFKRYWQQDLWNRLFSTLLNIPSCSEMPDLTPFGLEIQSLLRNKSRARNVVVEALRAKNF